MHRRYRAAVITAVVLAVAVVATGVLAVVRTSQLRAAEAEQAELAAQLEDARERIRELESEVAEAEPTLPGGLDDLLGDGGLGDLFGEGGLGDLFGEDRLRDLLDDLLGGAGGALGGLDAAELAACLQGDGTISVDDDSGADQFDDIESAVADLRALTYSEPVEPTYLDQAEISERISASVEREYTAAVADVDERVLAAVGAIPPGLDLRATSEELLGEQVAGYYDSDTGEMVVGTADPGAVLDPTEQVTLAHELTHAVTDQQLGLPEVLDAPEPDTDAALAALTLVEGDATLVMQRFATAALSVSEQLELATDPRAGEAQAALADYPYVLTQQLTFPYEQGLRFVCALHAEGSWAAVNRAYGAPPTTTAEVLFPERYGNDARPPAGQAPPDPPSPPASPGEPWEQLRTDTLGAATLKWLFEAPGDEPTVALSDPLARVRHWDGDTLTVWGDGRATAVGVALRDGGGEGPSLCASVTAWYDAVFADDREVATSGDEVLALEGGRQAAILRCPGDEVRLGIAPDVATARTIAR